MDTIAGAPPMRSPERWLAVLRIAVGVWFAKALFTKLSVTLLWGFLPVLSASDRWMHVMPLLVGKYADGNPVGFFREFMQHTVLAHSGLFAQLTAFGETAVGLGLVFGCLTALASGIGLPGRQLRLGGAMAGLGATGIPLHADHEPGRHPRGARGTDLGRGRLGAGAPPRLVAGAPAARLGGALGVLQDSAVPSPRFSVGISESQRSEAFP